MNIEHRTSNVQHRMLNEKAPVFASGYAVARKGTMTNIQRQMINFRQFTSEGGEENVTYK